MTDVLDVLRRHGYHSLLVKQVVEETDDARSFVLDVPDHLEEAFRYEPGQFCTFRVQLGGAEHFRCYSMSSAPETDRDLAVTVKRVDGGAVSNWFNDHVATGHRLDVARPSGRFCLRNGDGQVIGLCGGSGITPVISIAKGALASSRRRVRLLYANRTPDSVIFDGALRGLEDRYPEQFSVGRHFDSVSGFPEPATIVDAVDGDLGADFYVCGPGPFMELAERTLLGLGVEPGAILIERFETAAPGPPALAASPGDPLATVVLEVRGRRHEVAYHAGDTVLETARRANLPVPFSCEAGNCATCMALLREGSVKMRVNNALSQDEVDEGWILTCQSLPTGTSLSVEYEQL